MTVQDEIRQRIEKDALLARLRKKIDSGKGTYTDSFAYSDRAGKLLGEVFSRRLPDIPLEEREALCVELLRDRYTDINALCDRVQKALDEAQGLHLAPQHAPFNGERAHQIGSSLRDLSKPVEILQRRAESAPATATRAMHDDRMEAEAKFRSRAGLKCWITRKTDGKCCEWCDKMAGRFEYGEEPDDIYRRHDNCGCSVTYENGRQRQDVWSKRTWEAPKEGAGAGETVILTKEQAKNLQANHSLTVLTKSKSNGIIITEGAEHKRNPELEKTIRKCIQQERPVFAESLAKFYSRIPPEDGKMIVAAHGTPMSVEIYGHTVSAKIFANILRSRKDFDPSNEIILIACHTGNTDNTDNCFAQQLANELGMIVHAPTEFGAINNRGEYYSSDITGLKRVGDFIMFKSRRDEK